MDNQENKKTYTSDEVLEKVRELFSKEVNEPQKDIVLNKDIVTISFKSYGRKRYYKILTSSKQLNEIIEEQINDNPKKVFENRVDETNYILNFEHKYKADEIKRANFNHCIFLYEANFMAVTFNEVYFSGTIFLQKADFENAKFKERASFKNIDFQKKAYFRGASFTKKANFYNASFKDLASFKELKIKKGKLFNLKEADILKLSFNLDKKYSSKD